MIASRFAGSHFCSCATFPWRTATRTGCPRVRSAGRRQPQRVPRGVPTDEAERNSAGSNPARPPPIDDQEGRRGRYRRKECGQPIDADNAAACATGSTVTWLYPRRIHGKPTHTYWRPSSVVTHTAGASRSATASEHPAAPCDDECEDRGKEREISDQHAGGERPDHHALAAERRYRLGDPVQRARRNRRHLRPSRAGMRDGRSRPRSRHDERRQGNPGERRIAEFRKAEGEQRAREEG